jgi:PPM family protein phosphatase
MKETVEAIPRTNVDDFILTIYAYGVRNTGCVRENNEDAIYFDSPEPSENNDSKDYLVLIADGMGGHNGGEVASKLAIDQIRSFVDLRVENEVNKSLVKAFMEANRKIYQTGQENSFLSGMGTTCTALLIRGKNAYCAHVGDSRVYLVRNSSIYRMTEDHTMLMENRKNQKNDRSFNDPELESSLLTRALGIGRSVKIDTWPHGFPIKPKDRFLLCTDGLSDLVNDEDIKNAIVSNPLNEACHTLVKLANQRGGYDNISMIALFIDY